MRLHKEDEFGLGIEKVVVDYVDEGTEEEDDSCDQVERVVFVDDLAFVHLGWLRLHFANGVRFVICDL